MKVVVVTGTTGRCAGAFDFGNAKVENLNNIVYHYARSQFGIIHHKYFAPCSPGMRLLSGSSTVTGP